MDLTAGHEDAWAVVLQEAKSPLGHDAVKQVCSMLQAIS